MPQARYSHKHAEVTSSVPGVQGASCAEFRKVGNCALGVQGPDGKGVLMCCKSCSMRAHGQDRARKSGAKKGASKKKAGSAAASTVLSYAAYKQQYTAPSVRPYYLPWGRSMCKDASQAELEKSFGTKVRHGFRPDPRRHHLFPFQNMNTQNMNSAPRVVVGRELRGLQEEGPMRSSAPVLDQLEGEEDVLPDVLWPRAGEEERGEEGEEEGLPKEEGGRRHDSDPLWQAAVDHNARASRNVIKGRCFLSEPTPKVCEARQMASMHERFSLRPRH